MENKLIRATALVLATRLNKYTHKEGLEFEKLVLGMEIFLINVSKMIVVYLLAVLLGIVPITLIVQGAYVVIKRYSFGLHALNTSVCTLGSCIMFVGLPWLLQGVAINVYMVVMAFVPFIICLYLYAPADTEARPLVGRKHRVRLKKRAVVSGIVLMIVAMIVPSEAVKFLIVLGASYQVISILPITYKILRRSKNNYEVYEVSILN